MIIANNAAAIKIDGRTDRRTDERIAGERTVTILVPSNDSYDNNNISTNKNNSNKLNL